MIVGTAGHIDHGKSTLIEALTGTQTDRLPAERERGISIELGYAWLPVDNGQIVGFIDVPGHERLIHTMAAGATGIDFCLLVVAADDGVMPQTREHLAILSLLGLSQGAVAITKSDRVDATQLESVRDQVAALTSETFLSDAPVFALSAVRDHDEGVAALKTYLQERATTTPARAPDGLFRLAIDRAFVLKGHGTIVTGTVHDGIHDLDDVNAPPLALAPAGRPVRVRSIHAQNQPARRAQAGQRCALNLTGMDAAAISRGDWIADARCLDASTRMDVQLTLLRQAPEMGTWTPVHVHMGAAHRMGRVVPLEGSAIAPGSNALAQLVFDKPVCALPGDHFIIRDAQARQTIGGGRVLDAMAPGRRRRRPRRLAWLAALNDFLNTADLEALLHHADHGLGETTLMRLMRTVSPRQQIAGNEIGNERTMRWVERRRKGSDAASGHDEPLLIHEDTWRTLLVRAEQALQEFHERHPDEPGVDRARLRRLAMPTVSDGLWRALCETLLADGRLERNGPWLHDPGHAARLSDADQALAQLVLVLVEDGGNDPPWVRDLARQLNAAEEQMRSLMRQLLRSGDVYQVVPDLFYSRKQIRGLAQLLADKAQNDGITVAEFRDHVGLGRKRSVQILEFFNRAGLSRRVRDRHLLRPDGTEF
ncbi:MAG TPA: selenocysteine-specific translation elongation factor [Burkholderiaceae bacterium]|nr:selenocysteine-specific translation elongation factor [Burkholderiaceae bacterium]